MNSKTYFVVSPKQVMRRFATPLSLSALLVWSFALRVWLATPDLTASRFFDERYGVENIRELLVEGHAEPANGYHPGLSYLPHAGLLAISEGLHRLTGSALFEALSPDDITPTGYLLCRLVQVAAGTLSLYLVFWIGRRLASPIVGLASALLLAVVPWHLRQSVIFKPDIILVVGCLLAFMASLEAGERPNWWTFLRAGGAVGLALAAKFNAGAIAIPVLIAAFAEGGWRDRRRWFALALAAGGAALVFLIFTPFFVLDLDLYRSDFGRTLRDYARKGQGQGTWHGHVVVQGVLALTSEAFHGPVIGWAGLIGLVIAPLTAWYRRDRDDSRARRIGAAMAASYAASYALIYSLSTTNPSDHNWLPITPFISLFAAWLLVQVWRRLISYVPTQGRFAVNTIAVVASLALLVVPAHTYVYESVVPTTWDLAERHLKRQLRPLSWRLVVAENDDDQSLDLKEGKESAAVWESERLDALALPQLDAADAEVFYDERLYDTGKPFYQQRLTAPGVMVARFEPSLMHSRGPAVVVVVHPWLSEGEPVAVFPSRLGGSRQRFTVNLADQARPAELVSLEVLLKQDLDPGDLEEISIGGRALEAVWSGRRNGHLRFLIERFPIPAAEAQFIIEFAKTANGNSRPELRLRRWRRGSYASR